MPELNIDMMPVYYKRLFPYHLYYKWISYGNIQEKYFQNREFSFTLADDIYIRYQSFTNQTEMEQEFQKHCPHKIDIGAVFSYRPKDHRTVSQFIPLEKELVFDIDMTDYDEVRYCCQGADICLKCWKFMAVAVKILDSALREDFGFRHLLWVFSGRRGIHCWVCDESARKLSQQARTSIAEYLQVIKGGEQQTKKVNLPSEKIHPHISRSISIIEEVFVQSIIEEQDILGTAERTKKFLDLIPDQTLREKVETEMKRFAKGTQKWQAFERTLQGSKKRTNLREEIMLQFLYPRLDINVTKQLNHLLKSPFCVHPKTSKICVPIDPARVDKFDPDTVPTLPDIINELDSASSESSAKKDYEKTSLSSSIRFFKKFVENLEQSWSGKRIKISDEKMEF